MCSLALRVEQPPSLSPAAGPHCGSAARWELRIDGGDPLPWTLSAFVAWPQGWPQGTHHLMLLFTFNAVCYYIAETMSEAALARWLALTETERRMMVQVRMGCMGLLGGS